MNVSVMRKDLHEAMQVVGRTVSAQTSLPILRNVLIEPGEGTVRFSATDLDLAVEIRVPAQVQEPTPLTVPAKSLAEIVAALPEADVNLLGDGGGLQLRCRRAEYAIPGLSAEEFPAMPEVGSETSVSMPQAAFKRMIRQTIISTSTEDTRPILMGVLVQFHADGVRMVSTDTHRLAVREWPLQHGVEGVRSAIVPARALSELVRVLDDDEASQVLIKFDQNQIHFETPRVTLISRLIEGQFPNWVRVVPTTFQHRLTIPREELVAALRRVRIIARDASAKDRVEVTLDGDFLEMRATGDTGTAHESLEVLREGDDIKVALNVSYLLDVLGALDEEGVFLELKDPLGAVVVRPVGDDGYLMVIMPMAI